MIDAWRRWRLRVWMERLHVRKARHEQLCSGWPSDRESAEMMVVKAEARIARIESAIGVPEVKALAWRHANEDE